MINLSKAYSELGNKSESMRYAYAATELNANDETCFINLANLCLKYESLEQGVKAVEKAIEINDTSEIAYLTAARLLCEDNLYARARQILEKGCRKIADSHLLDGELVRVKFLEGSIPTMLTSHGLMMIAISLRTAKEAV